MSGRRSGPETGGSEAKAVDGGSMAVKVRMKRVGSTNESCFRVVAADGRSPRDGRFIEQLGWYDPRRKGVTFDLKLDRIEYWRSKGACLSDTVRSLVKKAKAAAKNAPAPSVAPEPAVPEPAVKEPEAVPGAQAGA